MSLIEPAPPYNDSICSFFEFCSVVVLFFICSNVIAQSSSSPVRSSLIILLRIMLMSLLLFILFCSLWSLLHCQSVMAFYYNLYCSASIESTLGSYFANIYFCPFWYLYFEGCIYRGGVAPSGHAGRTALSILGCKIFAGDSLLKNWPKGLSIVPARYRIWGV